MNFTFPEGITYKYRHTTGGDFIPTEHIVPYSTSYMYSYCKNNIIKISYDTSNVTDMSYMFNRSDMRDITQFDTSNVTNMSFMFTYCTKLTKIPLLDTSKVKDMSYMFNNANVLWLIPQLDTSSVTKMNYMFSTCNNLTTIPLLDTSSVTDMSNMFSNCGILTTIPQLNTSKVTTMSSMFYGCSNLTTIPQLNTLNVTTMSSMFYGCSNLTSVGKLYCGKISSGSNINIFSSKAMNNLTDLGGFEDLGKVSGFSKPSYFLKNCPNLTKESVMNVINNLYDRKTAGYSVVTLPFNTNSLNLLSDEEKAIATNKGWTLST